MDAMALKNIIDAHGRWRCGELDGERADLTGAKLDYSCWPLWCGSFDVKIDLRIAAQIAYHFCHLECDEPKYAEARDALLPLANRFHRIGKHGIHALEPSAIGQDTPTRKAGD